MLLTNPDIQYFKYNTHTAKRQYGTLRDLWLKSTNDKTKTKPTVQTIRQDKHLKTYPTDTPYTELPDQMEITRATTTGKRNNNNKTQSSPKSSITLHIKTENKPNENLTDILIKELSPSTVNPEAISDPIGGKTENHQIKFAGTNTINANDMNIFGTATPTDTAIQATTSSIANSQCNLVKVKQSSSQDLPHCTIRVAGNTQRSESVKNNAFSHEHLPVEQTEQYKTAKHTKTQDQTKPAFPNDRNQSQKQAKGPKISTSANANIPELLTYKYTVTNTQQTNAASPFPSSQENSVLASASNPQKEKIFIPSSGKPHPNKAKNKAKNKVITSPILNRINTYTKRTSSKNHKTISQAFYAPHQRKSTQLVYNKFPSLYATQTPKQLNIYRQFIHQIEGEKSNNSTINSGSNTQPEETSAQYNNRTLTKSNIQTLLPNKNNSKYPTCQPNSKNYILHHINLASSTTKRYKQSTEHNKINNLNHNTRHPENINTRSIKKQIEPLQQQVYIPIQYCTIQHQETSIKNINQETNIHSIHRIPKPTNSRIPLAYSGPLKHSQIISGNLEHPANIHLQQTGNTSDIKIGLSKHQPHFQNKNSSSTISKNPTAGSKYTNKQSPRIGTYSESLNHLVPKRVPPKNNYPLKNKNSPIYTANYYAPISDHQPTHPTMNQEDNENTHPPAVMTTARTTFQDVIRLNTYTPPPLPLQNGDWTLVSPQRELHKQEPVTRKHQDFPTIFPTTVADKHTLDIEEVSMTKSGMNIRIKLINNMQVDSKKLMKAMLACMQTVGAALRRSRRPAL